jgi:phosphate transport system permease protein
MSQLSDPTAPLTPSGNLRRRLIFSNLTEGGATLAAAAAVGVLGIIVFAVIQRGAGAISWDFITKDPPQFGGPGGGIADAIVGTGELILIATLIAMPVGVLVALYVTEFAGPRATQILTLALDLMNGLPTIVVGVFVYGLMVVGVGQSGFAGGVALSIVMLPLIARATQEVLRRVPGTLREAAEALGVSHWRTVIGVILPTAAGGIVTGTVLALARAAGETAPLILTTSIYANTVQLNPFGHALPNIPTTIFALSESNDPSGFQRAWGASLLLLGFILIVNITARTIVARSKASLTR